MPYSYHRCSRWPAARKPASVTIYGWSTNRAPSATAQNRESRAITGVGEIDLNAAATLAGKVAEKTHGDPVKAEAMYKTAASQAAGLVSQRVPTTARIASFAHVGWNTQSVLDDQTLQKIVDDVATAGNSHTSS
jgi:hypothetical protein